ncbi:CAP domain-containing protein [Exiguobacterium flavidum]|uniref:CAP domain-containing protein n=1 Tax=Exiguobacterium flavidum TaxID=2184695 RepID=UPI000DF796CF|nr:CAP domain-containing protein [Exiguobacterium flavidum]
MKKWLIGGMAAAAVFTLEYTPAEKVEASYPKESGSLIVSYASEYPGYRWHVRKSGTEEYVSLSKDGISYGKYRSKNGITTQGAVLNKDTETTLANKGWKKVTSYKKGNVYYRLNLDNAAVYEKGSNYVTYFFDQHDGDKVKATLAIPKTVEAAKSGYYGKASSGLRYADEKLMLRLMNWERADYKKGKLGSYTKLNPVTRAHSADMAKNNYFSHTNLKGQDPFDRMKAAGITFSRAGENLSMGYVNVFSAHWGLMNSKGHRVNILNGAFTQADTGVAFRGDTPYYTVNFRTP